MNFPRKKNAVYFSTHRKIHASVRHGPGSLPKNRVFPSHEFKLGRIPIECLIAERSVFNYSGFG